LSECQRDIGDSVETTVADTVADSSTGQARNIDLEYSWSEGAPWVAVVDDGHGMMRNTHIESVRFGSADPPADGDNDDLARFGRGMKTVGGLSWGTDYSRGFSNVTGRWT